MVPKLLTPAEEEVKHTHLADKAGESADKFLEEMLKKHKIREEEKKNIPPPQCSLEGSRRLALSNQTVVQGVDPWKVRIQAYKGPAWRVPQHQPVFFSPEYRKAGAD